MKKHGDKGRKVIIEDCYGDTWDEVFKKLRLATAKLGIKPKHVSKIEWVEGSFTLKVHEVPEVKKEGEMK